ncbi:hypothetical protein BDY21DRAFT_86528 [Lineolata rhizophorae]|uniref:Cora-like Mg2+ transporter protein-domain-containing protein n=1 Tax=Lineolata rhizophorae TaxID=578093 RepID=A0A6A6PC21_9PEZI|nr:hypothetical protein BDY21DRAFT_86528 [Lineolata rhizophorae]
MVKSSQPTSAQAMALAEASPSGQNQQRSSLDELLQWPSSRIQTSPGNDGADRAAQVRLPSSASSLERRSSLDDILRWPTSRVWPSPGGQGASAVQLPPSGSSSLRSTSLDQILRQPSTQAPPSQDDGDAPSVALPPSKPSSLPESRDRVNPPTSLEDLLLRPQDVPLPSSPRLRPRILSRKEGRARKSAKATQSREGNDLWKYQRNIQRLATKLPHLRAVNYDRCRHSWCKRIIFYDFTPSPQRNSQQGPQSKYRLARRHEPWRSPYLPQYEEFSNSIKRVPDGTAKRVILVEDLSPHAIGLIGATFGISPNFFEDHLSQSGYMRARGDRAVPAAWKMGSLGSRHSSITWFRPVLPLLRVSSRLRSRIIQDQKPAVACIFDEHVNGKHRISTTSNIWRKHLDLSPEPGIHVRGTPKEYPIAWEERATIWRKDVNNCNFVIILLDPLPLVTDRQEQNPRARPRNLTEQQQWKIERIQRLLHQHPSDAPTAFASLGEPTHVVHGSQSIQRRGSHQAPSAGLRRRSKTGLQSIPEAPARTSGSDINAANKAPAPSTSSSSTPPAPSVSHGPFAPFEQIKPRTMSSGVDTDFFSTELVTEFIEILRTPTSTLEDIDTWVTRPENKFRDPHEALFGAIHDDTLSMTDLMRHSITRIRETTMNESSMQRLEPFWRDLLHQFRSNMEEINYRLLALYEAVYRDSPRGENIGREKIRRDVDKVCAQLNVTMELVDKASASLRTEIQILDSRRSIAEAESVGKLTELAFIFIPVSFAASVFGMNIKELESGAPLYQFVVVALAFIFLAYFLRLIIWSSWVIEWKNESLARIRDEENLQSDERIPAHMVATWLLQTLTKQIFRIVGWAVRPFFIIAIPGALLAAILSPIVLLWLRTIDKGFTAVMTVLLLFFDILLLWPVVSVFFSGQSFNWDVRGWVNRIRRESKRKRSRKRARKLVVDVEDNIASDDETSDSDDSLTSSSSD